MIPIRISLQPKQKLFRKSLNEFPITFYGGAKGGGKSKGLRDIFLLRRFEYPGSHGAIFRKSYPDLEANHIRPLFEDFPALKEYWNDQKKIITLPNGSKLQFCYCANEADVESHQGREYHDLGIEEAGQWTENMLTRLRGSNRSSKEGVIPRTALTGNPGGVGHAYLKRVFIEKRYNEREIPTDYNFIQALVQDNQALLKNDPGYVSRLNAEPNEALRRAYLYGDWDIFAGQFFGEIDRSIHLIDPFEIPGHWSREGAYDYGFGHPGAFGWFAGDGDGNVYMYREFVKAGLRVDQFASEIKKHADTSELIKIPAGLDCWNQRNNTINQQQGPKPPTIAEEFATHGIYLSRANVDRIQGANQVRKYLAWHGRPANKPKLFIFNTCPLTFDTIARMQTDPSRIEDVLKVDASEGDPNTGDDCYDMLRYYLMSRPLLAEAPPPPKLGTKEYEKHQEEAIFQHNLDRMQKEKEIRDGQGINWQTDEDGVPDWNKW